MIYLKKGTLYTLIEYSAEVERQQPIHTWSKLLNTRVDGWCTLVMMTMPVSEATRRRRAMISEAEAASSPDVGSSFVYFGTLKRPQTRKGGRADRVMNARKHSASTNRGGRLGAETTPVVPRKPSTKNRSLSEKSFYAVNYPWRRADKLYPADCSSQPDPTTPSCRTHYQGW